MERFPDWTRLDVGRLKAAQELVALAARRENGNRQPVVRAKRRREQIALEVSCVPVVVRLALLEDRREPIELRKTDSGEDVAKTIVVPDFLMFVPGALLARLLGTLLRSLGEAAVVGHDCAAARCRHDLVAVEGVDAGETGGAGRTAVARCADGFGRVGHEDGAELEAEFCYRAVIAAGAIEANADDEHLRVL